MKTYKGTVIFRYYQEVTVEAESLEQAERMMFDAFDMHRADAESEIADLTLVSDNAKVECPCCDPCNPELDEQGRPYTCFACGDTGWVNAEPTEKEQI
jgi:Zn finger protein HypA/HybF involved in hydrogenase expression